MKEPRPTLRFERIELDYGRHSGVFSLVPPRERAVPAATNGSGNGAGATRGRPFVILGPNGAGKTTLLEAVVRTLFGFRRTTKAGRDTHERRRPWAGGPYRARVTVRTAEGRFTFERDFETDVVRVTVEARDAPLFEAEANPSRSGEKVRRYREILRQTIGIAELDSYRKTAWISQGGLLDTGISVDLLRVAAGGHTDVESAQKRLKKEYGALTTQPLSPGASRRRTPGELERLDAEIESLEAELARARALEERRAPLVHARDDGLARLDTLMDETERLESAFETLSEAQRIQTEIDAARARIRGLERATRELDEAIARLDLLDRQDAATDARYPTDFPERARLLEEGLWPRLAAIEAELARLDREEAHPAGTLATPRRLFVAGFAGLVAGLVVWLAGSTAGGLVLAVSGAGALAGGVARRRADDLRAAFRRGRRDELLSERAGVDDSVRETVADVPDGASLRPDALAAARRQFEREAADRRRLEEGEATLRRAVDAAARELELYEEGASGDEPPGGGGRAGLVDRANARLAALHGAVSRERDEQVAPLSLELRELQRIRFELPQGVEPTLEAVRAARRERLAETARVQKELAAVERDLAIAGRVPASALTLRRELADREERRDAVAARAAAYRAARRLLADAYEAFRTTDEERLLGAISGHLRSLSGGALGPILAEEGLDHATVLAGERALELASPPLSYGQWHAALLSVRIGASDFLAGLGVPLPLMIDDPFVHLDEQSVSELWDVLCRVAGRRQVVVATQDRLVLGHLGVSADLVLPRPPPSSAVDVGPVTDGEAADPGKVRRADPVLDLWDAADRELP